MINEKYLPFKYNKIGLTEKYANGKESVMKLHPGAFSDRSLPKGLPAPPSAKKNTLPKEGAGLLTA
jgi:hypothetical protein